MLILSRVLQRNVFRTYATVAAVKNKPKIKPRAREAPALIECKRPEFNLYELAPAHSKFGTVPLASKGWFHKRSKGDNFTIKATVSEEQRKAEMVNVDEFLNTSKMHLCPELVENLKHEFDITHLTQIQALGFPEIYDCHHALVAAETGCGKTLAYLVPIAQRIFEHKRTSPITRRMNTPLAMILTPGRELALQIGNVAEKLTKSMDLNVKTVVGGHTKRLMMNPEFEDIDILVASIGGLSKLVTTGIYRVEHVRHVVLDEADTLLDDSFSEKLTYFMRRFPFHKVHMQSDTVVGTQLVLASATMPTNINEALRKVIDVETIHEVVSPHLHKLMPHVEQKFQRITKADRPAHLLNIVKTELTRKRPIVIFSNKSPTSDYVSIFLNNCGVKCVNLNGDMLRVVRIGRFEQFQSGECDVLSTTDVGSRGLDTTRARHVINFDFPLHVSDYIHRCGRIGRVSHVDKCLVTNLISSRSEIDVVQRIEHAARIGSLLPNVNANIRNIINKRILADMKAAGIAIPEEEKEEEEAF